MTLRGEDPSYRGPVVEAEFNAFRYHLPTRGHHVYVLRDGEDRALYVGQSRTPRLRIRTHWRNQPWWPDVAAIELYSVGDEMRARLLERKLTDQLAPVHSEITWADDLRLSRLQGEG